MAIKHANTAQEATPDIAALAALEETAPASYARPTEMVLGEITGDVDDVKLKLPYLQISQAQGGSSKFLKGSIIVGDFLIANPGESVNITILSASTYWLEYFEDYDPKRKLASWKTKQEVIDHGGTWDWTNGKGPTFKRALACEVLIEKPAGVTGGPFGIDLGGKIYAAAHWNTNKNSTACVLPTILSDLKFALNRRGLYSGIYKLTGVMTKFKKAEAPMPKITLTGCHTDDEVRDILALFGDVIRSPADVEGAAVVDPGCPL